MAAQQAGADALQRRPTAQRGEEVADSSADYHRGTKAPLYARGGIAELWIVDLNRDHLVVYRDPTSAGYATTRVLRCGESIGPLAFPELEITVDEILG